MRKTYVGHPVAFFSAKIAAGNENHPEMDRELYLSGKITTDG